MVLFLKVSALQRKSLVPGRFGTSNMSLEGKCCYKDGIDNSWRLRGLDLM